MRENVVKERVHLPGSAGALAGELAYPTDDPRFACVMCNPHPHMGGSVENPVIAAAASAVAEAGGVSLRFDYGGVGSSEGPRVDVAGAMAEFWATGRTPQDQAMLEDGLSALRWLARTTAGLPITIAGYSFGAHVAARCLGRHPAAAVAMISPTLLQHDFSPLHELPHTPLLVVYSDDDFATPAAITEQFIASVGSRATAHCIAGGQHFFRGRESLVGELLAQFLSESVIAGASERSLEEAIG